MAADKASAREQIERICNDPDNLESGENAPTEKAIGEMSTLLDEAATYCQEELPSAHIVPFWGEVSATWHNGDRFLKALSFSTDHLPMLVFGVSVSGEMGHFHQESPIDGQRLAEKIRWCFSGKGL